jgi:hypothetical protein
MEPIDLDPIDGEDSLGINDLLDHVGKATESIIDFVIPDWLLEWDVGLPEEAIAGGTGHLTPIQGAVEGKVPPEMVNDGFYQSLPGVDPFVGVELDQTYDLISQINDLGTDILGPEGWEQTKITAADEIRQFEDTIESPADLEYRFTVDDAQRQREFWAWQDRQYAQDVIDDSRALLKDPDRPL